MSIYLQRPGKNNTNNLEALLKKETIFLQHNQECLFRNLKDRPTSQTVGSLRTMSALSLHTANSDTHPSTLPSGAKVFLFLFHIAQVQVTAPRCGLTPPHTSGARVGWLDSAWCKEPDSEVWQIYLTRSGGTQEAVGRQEDACSAQAGGMHILDLSDSHIFMLQPRQHSWSHRGTGSPAPRRVCCN